MSRGRVVVVFCILKAKLKGRVKCVDVDLHGVILTYLMNSWSPHCDPGYNAHDKEKL